MHYRVKNKRHCDILATIIIIMTAIEFRIEIKGQVCRKRPRVETEPAVSRPNRNV